MLSGIVTIRCVSPVTSSPWPPRSSLPPAIPALLFFFTLPVPLSQNFSSLSPSFPNNFSGSVLRILSCISIRQLLFSIKSVYVFFPQNRAVRIIHPVRKQTILPVIFPFSALPQFSIVPNHTTVRQCTITPRKIKIFGNTFTNSIAAKTTVTQTAQQYLRCRFITTATKTIVSRTKTTVKNIVNARLSEYWV